MREMAFSLFLVLASWQDLKRQKISVWLLILFAVAGVGIRGFPAGTAGCTAAGLGILAAMAPGFFLLAVTGCSRGAIGSGDGCFFLAAACYLAWRETLLLLISGLFCSSLCSLGWLVFGLIRGRSMRKKRLPFLPFLIPAWIGILCL